MKQQDLSDPAVEIRCWTLVEPQAKPRGIVFRDVRLNFGEFILLKFTNSRCYPEFFNSHNYVDSPLKKEN